MAAATAAGAMAAGGEGFTVAAVASMVAVVAFMVAVGAFMVAAVVPHFMAAAFPAAAVVFMPEDFRGAAMPFAAAACPVDSGVARRISADRWAAIAVSADSRARHAASGACPA